MDNAGAKGENSGMSHSARLAWTLAATAALVVTGCLVFTIGTLGASAFGVCQPGMSGCQWEMTALWIPANAAVLGLLVGGITPWVPRGRPRPLWTLIGFAIQALGIVIVLVLVSQIDASAAAAYPLALSSDRIAP